MRWSPGRKAHVVTAVEQGLLSIEEALRDCELSLEELEAWRRDFKAHGIPGLRSTRVQIYGNRRSTAAVARQPAPLGTLNAITAKNPNLYTPPG